MAKDKKGKPVKNNTDIKEELQFIAVAVVFLILLFLINIPFIFNYQIVPIVGKVFMIMGSASVAILLALSTVVWIKKVREKLPKDIVTAIVIFCLYYVYAILAYFDFDVWGSKIYVSAIVIAGIIIHSAYNAVSRFQDFFNGERIIVLLIALAWFFVFLSSAKNTQISETFLKIAVGIVYAISVPCFIRATLFSKRNKARSKHIIFLMMVGIIIGAGIIISFPFYVNWCGLKDNNFTTFVSVYSALVGGGLTLAGVAWTIRKSDKDKKEEERKKYKPVFTANRVLSEVVGITAQKVCFDYDDTSKIHTCTVIMEIENSNSNAFSLKKVFHDNRWWEIAGDTTVLPDKKVIFHFSFDEDVNNIFLQVQDGLENNYYYEVKVLLLRLIPGCRANSMTAHTIRELKEISLEEVEKRTAESKKEERKEESHA